MNDLDLEPCTIEDARKTIKILVEKLIYTQEIAIDRGDRLIALNLGKLGMKEPLYKALQANET